MNTHIYVQSFAVVNNNTSFYDNYITSDRRLTTIQKFTSNVPQPGPEILPSILKTSFSSVPMIRQSALLYDYWELGEALGQMVGLQDEDELEIDASVFVAASFLAAGLMANQYAAPRVFAHGRKSVVFNWSNGDNNLYLTISADRVSALVSTPERIDRRFSMSLNELRDPSRIFFAIGTAPFGSQAPLQLTPSVVEPFELVY